MPRAPLERRCHESIEQDLKGRTYVSSRHQCGNYAMGDKAPEGGEPDYCYAHQPDAVRYAMFKASYERRRGGA